jgi:hypothetical protein
MMLGWIPNPKFSGDVIHFLVSNWECQSLAEPLPDSRTNQLQGRAADGSQLLHILA